MKIKENTFMVMLKCWALSTEVSRKKKNSHIILKFLQTWMAVMIMVGPE